MNESQRIGLFLLVCIPVRLFLVYWAIMVHSIKDKEWSRTKYILDVICLVIGLSFVYQAFYGKSVGGFGGKVWWGHLRIIHAMSFLACVVMSYYNVSFAYWPLLFSVFMGLISFGLHRLSVDGWKPISW